MTQKETLAAIRAMGLAVSYSSEWGEWRVTYRRDNMPSAERREAVAVYTDDADEALNNARALKAHAAEHGYQ